MLYFCSHDDVDIFEDADLRRCLCLHCGKVIWTERNENYDPVPSSADESPSTPLAAS
jgi:hypothetical protein